ncbi:MAG: polysaccharide export protein [Acidobacteriota bacterium]|nr:polysaccharide export protein [Acidobacteriota bacterium]
MSKLTLSIICVLCIASLGQAAQQPVQQPASPAQSELAPKPAVPERGEPGEAKGNLPEKQLPKPAAGVDPNTYVIGPEDIMYVRVWKDPDLSGMVDVRPDGMISMQLVGEIKAAGLTPEQLSKVLTEHLLETHKHPEVNVQIVKVLSKKYFIQGEVHRPGSYPLVVPTRVLEALVNAGGFNDFANAKKIYILRGTQKFPFNYKDVSKGKHTEQNIMVQNGDQIFVP